VPFPPAVTYSARYLDRDERYEIARLRGAGTLPCPAGGSRPRPGPVPLGHQPGAGPPTPTPAPGATCPSGRTSWPGSGSGARSRLGWPLTRRCGRRCRSWLDRRYSPEQGPAGGSRVQFPDDPAMRASHETDLPVALRLPRAGGWRRELKASAAGRARAARRPRGRGPEGPREDHRRGSRIGPGGRRRLQGRLVARPPRGRPGHGHGGVQLRGRHHRSSGPPATSPCCTCRTGTPPTPSPAP